MKAIVKILAFFCLFSAQLTAAVPGTPVERELRFLTDSLQGGRAFGSPEAQSTTFYLLRQFRNQGLRTMVQSFEYGGKTGHNVVAVTPGWFKQYIVVGAYYDGLGMLSGEFYPGADSNASGVAALLTLARELPAACKGDVGLIFVAFDGHNASMSGSKEFVARYASEYDIKLMVNLDILGSGEAPLRKGRPDYILALGGATYRLTMQNANRMIGLDMAFDYYGSRNFTDLFYRKISDQKWFLDAGIPAVMFTSGITMNTNKVTDTISNIDLDLLSKRVAFISRWINSLI